MSISGITFLVWFAVGAVILAALLWQDFGRHQAQVTVQERVIATNDSSLPFSSVNWMAGIAFAVACFVCFFLG